MRWLKKWRLIAKSQAVIAVVAVYGFYSVPVI
jgi:hypothetical protein